MADLKISELIDANLPLSGAEETAIVQGGVTKKTAINNFISNFESALNLKEDKANKGVADGYAPLNSSGLIDSVYLPSFVDDVIEVADFVSLPLTGESGKIYVTLDNNKIYRWSGTVYIEISENIIPNLQAVTDVGNTTTNPIEVDASAFINTPAISGYNYHPTVGQGVLGVSEAGEGVLGSSSSGNGVYGYSVTDIGVHGNSTDGVGVLGYSENGNAGVFDIVGANTSDILKLRKNGVDIFKFTSDGIFITDTLKINTLPTGLSTENILVHDVNGNIKSISYTSIIPNLQAVTDIGNTTTNSINTSGLFVSKATAGSGIVSNIADGISISGSTEYGTVLNLTSSGGGFADYVKIGVNGNILSLLNSGDLGIGTNLPTAKLDVNGSIRLRGTLLDINNQAGTSGQILSSTGDGVDWIDASTILGTTNLSYTESPTNGIVVSDTGTDATIPLANGTNAGLLSPSFFSTLNNGVWSIKGNSATNATTDYIGTSDLVDVVLKTNNTELIRLNSANNVVSFNNAGGIQIRDLASTSTGLTILPEVTGSRITLSNNTSGEWRFVKTNAQNITFFTNSIQRFQIQGGGAVSVVSTASLFSCSPIARFQNSVIINSPSENPTKTLDVVGEARIRIIPTGLSSENILVHNANGDIRSIVSSTFQTALTNPITGTGASGQVAFFNGTTTQTSDTNLFWDDTNKRLGIGTNTPSYLLNIVQPTGQTTPQIVVGSTTNSVSEVYGITFRQTNSGAFFGYSNQQATIVAGNNKKIGFYTQASGQVADALSPENGTVNALRMVIEENSGAVGIGSGSNVNSSALLEVSSTSRGILFPRMTTTQKNAISSPANGLVVYDSTTNKLCVRAGGVWVDLH